MQQFTYIIRGLVQGVGFRQFVYSKATRWKLKGYVRNLENGSVECIAEGSSELLVQLERILEKGPTFSRVDSIHKEKSYRTLPQGFQILA